MFPGLACVSRLHRQREGGARGMRIHDSDPAVDLDPDDEPDGIKRSQGPTFAPVFLSEESPEESSHHSPDRSLWFTRIGLM